MRSAVSGPSSHGVPWSRKVWSLPISITGREQHSVMGIAPHAGIRTTSLLCRYKALWPQTSYVSWYLVSHLRTGELVSKPLGEGHQMQNLTFPDFWLNGHFNRCEKPDTGRRRVLQTLSDTWFVLIRTQTMRKLASLKCSSSQASVASSPILFVTLLKATFSVFADENLQRTVLSGIYPLWFQK